MKKVIINVPDRDEIARHMIPSHIEQDKHPEKSDNIVPMGVWRRSAKAHGQ